jgi:hypothetical protein
LQTNGTDCVAVEINTNDAARSEGAFAHSGGQVWTARSGGQQRRGFYDLVAALIRTQTAAAQIA